MTAPTLAVDFGTSNSAAAIMVDGKVRRLQLEAGADTLPTAVFLPSDGGPMLIGRQAETALTEGDEGRYMRALKSVLGTPLFHESRMIGGRRRAISDIVTALLAQLKLRAELAADARFSHVLSGRPVHFHSSDAGRDAQAEADLRSCYLAAGFESVAFMAEPEAAALATSGIDGLSELRMIVDIGGGTSDFSVVRTGPHGVEVVTSHGIRLGGTDFDQAISMAYAMPAFGLGGQLRRTFGDGLLPVPRALFSDLATWAMIPFLYTRETERAVADLVRHAVQPLPLQRLGAVIEHRLGHDLAFAVERGKIAANAAKAGACIDLGGIERGLTVPLSAGLMNAALAPMCVTLRTAMYETLFHAKVPAGWISAIVLVGGSSMMSLIEAEARSVCLAARVIWSEAFTAVVDGLALATTRLSDKP